MRISHNKLKALNTFSCRYDSAHDTLGVVTSTRNIKVDYSSSSPLRAPLRSHITTYSTTVNHTNGSTTRSLNQSQGSDIGSEVEDGPTFMEAIKIFQKDSGASASPVTSTFNRSSRSSANAHHILTGSTQQIQRTIHTTSSNKSYHVEES